MTEKQSTLTGIDKKYRYFQSDGDYPKIIKGDINYCFAFPFDAQMLCEELNKMVEEIETLKLENEQLKQTSQDYEDIVNNWFINNWDKLSDEMKQSAHLEVGIDIEYDGDYE